MRPVCVMSMETFLADICSKFHAYILPPDNIYLTLNTHVSYYTESFILAYNFFLVAVDIC